ncbi:uncharacterized protein F21D5.5 [Epargyreus clarus]|uniref:uncharacterized protein F21D5.5 n=1 Tax=Epargyreus clarus TaxID=520877 RepID=UPI003C2CF356
MIRQCFLRCLKDSHAPIALPHNVETIIGRSKLTKIKDQSCSRNQISLTADCDACVVEVKQLGINTSGLDGFALKSGDVYKVEHGSRIEVLLNQYIHVIEFEPPPDNCEEKTTKKRKFEEDSSPHKKMKRADSDPQTDKTEVQGSLADIWEEIDNGDLYIFTSKGVKSSAKIAAFDMDGTLIKTKSGKVHPVDTNDWQIAFPTIPQKLADEIKKGFKVIILSNQAPIGNGRVKIADFKKKIENLVKTLNIPVQVYIATGRGFYRKPMTGMWKTLMEKKNDSIPVDMDNSYYCGDAAGRLANWAPGKKKDHSMADKLFAENLGLKFYLPEQFFLGHPLKNIQMSKPDFVPMEVKSEPFHDKLISKEREILVCVGYPGSGKSFLAKQIEKKSNYQYATVCRDVLGSWQKCAAEATRIIERGKSVIVDSTNPDLESRGRWTALAKQMKVECRCAKMATTKAHAQHNNKFREIMKINHVPVNDIVFNMYKNKFVEPTVAEGFKEVIEVKISPSFDDKEAEKIYKIYLLEK